MTSKRKETILTAAMQLIVENGLSELTMSNVARRMEFSEPAMYRHFRNKQDLIICLIKRISSRFEEVFNTFDQNEAPEVFFPKYFEAQLRYLEQVRGVTILFLSESVYNREAATRNELQTMFRNQTGRVAAYIELAQARGQIRQEVDPAAAALVYMGTIQAITTRFLLSSETVDIFDSSQLALAIFLKGVIA